MPQLRAVADATPAVPATAVDDAPAATDPYPTRAADGAAATASFVLPAGGPPVPGYEVLGVLGRGGMGVVYKARQLRLNRVVALKMILAGETAGEVARFQVEAESVARLQHPNIIQIHEVGEADGRPYLALEYAEGGTLAQRLNGVPLPAARAARLVEALARAMHHAHQQGVVHRDLKPANVLLAGAPDAPLDRCVPRISDFGLAKRLEGEQGNTQTGTILGTPSYMAPEQAAGRGKQVGPAADVYALGAIFYECLTGRPPFRAETPLETVMQVLTHEPVPPSRLQPKLPRDAETVCLKCLQKQPAQRYATAEELAEDLRRFHEGEPIRARPTSAAERALKWVRRRPALAALLVITAVAALALVGVTVSMLNNRDLRAAFREVERARQAEEAQREETRAAWDRSERQLYCFRVLAAERELLAANATRAHQLLDDCPPALRRWEWYYLKRMCPSEVLVFHGAGGRAGAVAFSPDGRRLAAGTGRAVTVWDLQTGKEALTLPGPPAVVTAVAFSPDGKHLAVGTAAARAGTAARDLPADGEEAPPAGPEVKVWDLGTGRAVRTVRGQAAAVGTLAFSPDGGRLAGAGGDGTVRLWDWPTGRELFALPNPAGADPAVCFSPDGKRLAGAGGDAAVRVWDAAAGRLLLVFHGHRGPVRHLRFTPDGDRLVSVGADGAGRVWDAATGEVRKEFTPGRSGEGHAEAATVLALDGGGRRVALLRGVDLKVQDTENADYEATVRGAHPGKVVAAVFGPDDRHLVTVCESGSLKLWDLRAAQDTAVFRGHGAAVTCVALSADGRRAASGSAVPRDEAEADRPRTAVPEGPAGPRRGVAKVWDVLTGQELLSLEHAGPVLGVAFGPDGGRLAGAGEDGTVRVWDAATGRELLVLRGHREGVLGVAFSPDGRRLATAGRDQTARVWDAETGAGLLTLTGHARAVYGVAYSPDGRRLATASADGTARVWDATTGRELFILGGHADEVEAVVFSREGRRLATASHDHTVKVWDAATGRELRTLRGHTGPVTDVAFNPAGQRLASSSEDTTVKLWDVETGREVFTLRGHHAAVEEIDFSPDGHHLASAGVDRTVRVWDATPPDQRAAGPEAGAGR